MSIGRRGLLLGAGAVLISGPGTSAAPRRRDETDSDALYHALRTQPAETLEIAGGRIRVVFDHGASGVDRKAVAQWVERSARAVSTYFGRYPSRMHGILVVAEDGNRVGHATTYGYDGALTRISVGSRATATAFARDWVLVHEMVHTALPTLPRRALWLEEGNATWVEPVAQAQAGDIPASEVWSQAIAGMPRGIRDSSAGGMDGTQEWGRLYWGGATFWLLAEIAAYEASDGRAMLRDALRAINRESGGNIAMWTPEKMMERGDAAICVSALQSLYTDFATRSPRVDLAATFRRLGVSMDAAGKLRFDDSAQLARLTRRITQP